MNEKVYVLLDNDPVGIFGVYSSFENMVYAYNNLTQKEKNTLKEFRVISLDTNKSQNGVKGVNSQHYFVLEAGVLSGEKYFPFAEEMKNK